MEKTFMARKMENVGPNQNQRFTGCGRSVARAWSANGYAGARGEGAAKVTVWEVG
jgi:hypothetical protein